MPHHGAIFFLFPDLFRFKPLLICHLVLCSRIHLCGRRVQEPGQQGVKPLGLRMQRKDIHMHFQKASPPSSLAWAVVGSLIQAARRSLRALQWGQGLACWDWEQCSSFRPREIDWI